MAAVFPLACRREISGTRESGDGTISFYYGVPAAMIEVQMTVDHNVDFLRRDARSGQIVEQFGGLSVDIEHLLRELVANSGFDQHRLMARAHHDRVQTGGHAVVRIRLRLLLPQDFGHNSEEGAAVERIDAVRNCNQFKVAQGKSTHLLQLPFE